jgi:very-short-patch-repair endonuclease
MPPPKIGGVAEGRGDMKIIMDFLHQDPSLKARRKELRNNQTPQERKLWNYLRSSTISSKFERQHSIGPYIVDFYCARQKLVIELDGKQHLDNKEYDAERTRYLEALGFKVLRFWNEEIDSHISDVLTIIKNACNKTKRTEVSHNNYQ